MLRGVSDDLSEGLQGTHRDRLEGVWRLFGRHLGVVWNSCEVSGEAFRTVHQLFGLVQGLFGTRLRSATRALLLAPRPVYRLVRI